MFVYRALEAPEEYIGFVVLGGALTAFWLNVVWMMAAQFYWEKDQGNLELYFTAPMHLMSILAGMAIGGLVLTSSRALAVIGIGSLLYGVTYDIQQPLLLAGVFLLTMIPLYGMGMLFASLFLLWGREAYHLAELLQEPIYFLGGVNFPLRAIGAVAGVVMATLPLGVGLDAMRQLAFAGSGVQGVLPVGAEVLILAAMGVVFLVAARLALRLSRAPRPARGTPDAAMAVTEGRVAVRGITLADAWRSFRTAIGLGLGDRVELVGSVPVRRLHHGQAARGGRDPRRHVPGHLARAQNTGFLQFLIVGSALWNVVFGVMAGLVQSILEDRERYRMLKYVVVTPASLFPFLLGRSLARVVVSFVAVALTLLVGVVFLGVELRPNFLILVPATDPRRPRRHRARHLHGRLVPPAAPGGVALPRGDRRRALPRLGRHLPDRRAAGASSTRSRTRSPTTWWLEASRRGLLGHGSPGRDRRLPDGVVMLFLVVSTAITIPAGARSRSRWFMRRARQAGLLDMVTGS